MSEIFKYLSVAILSIIIVWLALPITFGQAITAVILIQTLVIIIISAVEFFGDKDERIQVIVLQTHKSDEEGEE